MNIVGLDVINKSCLTWICRVSTRNVDRPEQQHSISPGCVKFYHFFYIRSALHDSQFKISQSPTLGLGAGPHCILSLK